MKIIINGEETTIDGPRSVKQLLAERGLSSAPCAVEVNSQLVPKRRHEEHTINEGDRIEIVTLVGGG